MKIDTLDNAAFEGVGRDRNDEGLSLAKAKDNPMSLSAPFINPYTPNLNTTISSNGRKGLTAAERNNNPFNIKYGSFAAKYGATKENKNALDGGSFATFSSPEVGLKAAKDLLTGNSYKNLTVDKALRKWSNNGYGGNIFPEIANKRITDLSSDELDNLQKKQIVREDRNYAKKLGIYKFGGFINEAKSESTKVIKPKKVNKLLNEQEIDNLSSEEKVNIFVKDKYPEVSLNYKVGERSNNDQNNITINANAKHQIFGELAHTEQYRKTNTLAKNKRVFKDNLKVKNPEELYYVSGTLENEAHDILEPVIRKKYDKYQKDLSTVKNQKVLKDKLSTMTPKYKYGGKLKSYALGGYNTTNPLSNGLNKFTTPQALDTLKANNTKTPINTGFGRTANPTQNVSNAINTSTLSTGLSILGTGVESFDSNPNKVNKTAAIGGGVLKGAGAGATVGSVIPGWGTAVGAVVGGVAGGITSGIKAKKRQNLINQNVALDQKNFNSTLQDRSRYLYGQMNPYTYKFGGSFKPEYEVEKNEVVQGNNITLEKGKQLTSNLHLVKGNTHENGGTLGSGGDRVFSNSISFNGKTPAKLATSIGNKLKKFEPLLSSKDRMKRITAEKMTTKLNEELNSVFDSQEEFKQTPQFKFGGNLPKFKDGGDIEADKRRIASLEKYLKDNKFESASSKRTLNAEIDKLRNRVSKAPSTGSSKPWNPFDKTSVNVGSPFPKRYIPELGNNLDEVVIKGKRTVVPEKTITTKKSTSKLPPVKKNSYGKVELAQNRQIPVNPLAGGLSKIPVPVQSYATSKSQASQNTKKGLNIDPTLATSLGLSTIGYLNQANNINRMSTDVPVNLTASPYYGYKDRSRLARQDLNASANTILRDANVSSGNKQAIFSRLSQGVNQINSQENENRYAYDNAFNGQALQINAQNNALLTQAQQQRIANQNSILGAKSQNFSSYLVNINTAIAEQNAMKVDQDKFRILSDVYKRKYNTNFDVNI